MANYVPACTDCTAAESSHTSRGCRMDLNVVLISTYELGRQPFGLASPAAWLRAAGAQVDCCDLAVEPLREAAVCAANLIAFYVPMHMATRMAVQALARVRQLN